MSLTEPITGRLSTLFLIPFLWNIDLAEGLFVLSFTLDCQFGEMALLDLRNVEEGRAGAKTHADQAHDSELSDLAGHGDEEYQGERQHENVRRVGEPIPIHGHSVPHALTVAKLIDDGHVGDLDGGPTDIKDGREDQIPGILAASGAEKVEAKEDAEEGGGD